MSEGLDFFISYTHSDQQWAEWIAWQLEQEGYTTRIQAWDFRPGDDFVEQMHKAVAQAKRIVPVLSPAYFESVFATKEWTAIYARDATVLLPVRVVECKPDGLLKPIVHIDLVGQDATSAREALIAGVNSARAKPSIEPTFPGERESRANVAARSTAPLFPADLPRIWTLTLQRNEFFKGRAQDLSSIRDALKTRDGGVHAPVVLYGLGGVGKTQLAMEYAWYARAQYDYVFWIEGNTPASLRANLAALAAEGVLTLAERETKDESVRLRAVLSWLARTSGWLVLLDNLDAPEAAEAALSTFREVRRGHVLMTSRRADWPLGVVTLPIEVLHVTAAREFLIERSQRLAARALVSDDEADIAEVAERLGFLPLALEQAAAYVAKHRIDYRAYLDRVAKTPKVAYAFGTPGATNLEGDQRSIFTTWSVTEVGLGSAARAILRLIAFFAPEDIPRELMGRAPSVFAEAMSVVGDAASPVEHDLITSGIESGLVELAGYSLIKLGSTDLSCHLLQQAVQRERLTRDEKTVWITLGLRLVLAASPQGPPDDLRNWPFWTAVRPHAAILIAAADAAGIASPTTRLMSRLGRFLASKAEWSESERLQRRTLAIDDARFGSQHPTIAIHLNNLAQLLLATGQKKEAESLMRKALTIHEQSHGIDHLNVAIHLNNLGQLLLATDQLQEAESLMRRSLTIHERSDAMDHPSVAVLLNNLAQLLFATNRLQEAEPLVRSALTLAERIYGADHPKVAIRLNNLAQLLAATNRLEHARSMMRRSLVIFLSLKSRTGYLHLHHGSTQSNYERLLAGLGWPSEQIQSHLSTLEVEAYARAKAGTPKPS